MWGAGVWSLPFSELGNCLETDKERQTGRASLTSEGLFAWAPPRLSPWGWPDHVLVVTQARGREVAVNLECALQATAVVSA